MQQVIKGAIGLEQQSQSIRYIALQYYKVAKISIKSYVMIRDKLARQGHVKSVSYFYQGPL